MHAWLVQAAACCARLGGRLRAHHPHPHPHPHSTLATTSRSLPSRPAPGYDEVKRQVEETVVLALSHPEASHVGRGLLSLRTASTWEAPAAGSPLAHAFPVGVGWFGAGVQFSRLCGCSRSCTARQCSPTAYPLQVYDEVAAATRGPDVQPGANRPRAVLFEGPPGTGKTTCVRWVLARL